MARRRPNSWENRYNQWVLAGKIAIETKAIPVPGKEPNNVYRADSGEIHYSMIGQTYLRELGLEVTEL